MPLGSAKSLFDNTDKLEIIVLNQGNNQELPVVRYHKSGFSTYPISSSESLEVLNSYRKLGVVFGANSGAGDPSSSLTFAQVPSLYDMGFGTDDPIIINSGGKTGTIEQICGAISGGFASETTINNSTNDVIYDWVSLNLEPYIIDQVILRGFVGEPNSDDRPVDAAGGTVGFPNHRYLKWSQTTGKTAWTNYPLFYLGDDDTQRRNNTIQLLKSYDDWVNLDSATGGAGDTSGLTSYYSTSDGLSPYGQPNINIAFQASEYPTYYNLYKACLYSNIKGLNYCRPYVRNTLGFNKNPKVMLWWKSPIIPVPLGGLGWFNNPVWISAGNSYVFSNDHLTAASFSARCFGPTTVGFIPYKWDKTNNSVTANSPDNNNFQWSSSTANYPIGSHESRARALAFEAVSNFSDFNSADMDCIAAQFYYPIYDQDLREICATSNWDFTNFTGSNSSITGTGEFMGGAYFDVSATGATLVPIQGGDSWVPKSNAEVAVYKASRLNWLAYNKYFGNKASVGMELHMDLFIPRNTHLGFATNHDDFERIHLKSLYDPVTQEEASLYGLTAGVVYRPKYFAFWTATYYYLSLAFGGANQILSDSKKEQISGYLRGNLKKRFPPPEGMGATWSLGSEWHRYLCRKLDEFGIERVKRVREFSDSFSIGGGRYE